MQCKQCKWIAVLAVASLVAVVPSCGRDQQLVSISIEPTTETFGAANIPVSANAGSTVQLRALGTYIHPPVTKDISNQATWASSDIQMITVNSTGAITATGLVCGATLISATVKTNTSSGGISSSNAIVTGNMTANVVCFTGTGPALTINFRGSGTGTVVSSPTGLSCMGPCTGSFPTGTTVALTATPNSGSTFGGWSGCDVVSGAVCTAANLTADRSVTVTFN